MITGKSAQDTPPQTFKLYPNVSKVYSATRGRANIHAMKIEMI
ncbi:MAG: hypothetical protein QOH51_2607 [Acidobacteriota bacterium]|jgi:hypothetical protein|nr:hypothetical protein [Acidobacteriota bacterium]